MNSLITIFLAQSGGGPSMLIPVILMVGVFYVVIFAGQRKDKKKRQEMLAAIKKNDRVMTVGGILGSVVSVSEHEVSLKVDESANVKISVLRSAIQKVLTEGEKPSELR